MSDILNRLTTQAERGILDLPDNHVFVSWADAAKEIERLREALEMCADVTEKWPYNLARQVNEIARAALAEQEEK